MKPIATATSDFPDLRRKGCIYVDKTAYFHRLVSNVGSNILFLSRPRRFGKSLMISTLKAIFQGRRELFEGLDISRTDWSWETYPVIHFNMAQVSTVDIPSFQTALAAHVRMQLKSAGYEYDETESAVFNFGCAIQKLSEVHGGRGVVILIDEYDAPVGHVLDDVAKAETVRNGLSAIYSQMKDRTGSIRFLMMTGVSKFTKLSVFSALNNIRDISQDDDYATMLGYTEEELSANFEEHLRAHAEKMGRSYEDYRAELKRWYNGFRFAREVETTVYNPISIAYTLDTKSRGFSATWATTGRPSMLMNFLKREDVLDLDYEKVENVSASEFDVADLHALRPIPLLYQAGYLTVKDYDVDTQLFTLGVPDEEVRRDVAQFFTGAAADEDIAWAASLGGKLVGCDWPRFFAGLKALYARLPYGALEGRVHEYSYERILCTLLASQGITYTAEDVQSDGRADIVATHKKAVWIFELKVGESVDDAFGQIRAKGYDAPYRASGKPIWAVGLSFDRGTHRLVETAAQQL